MHGPVARIPAEEFVGPLAGEQYLGAVFSRELADQETADDCGIRKWFLQMPNECRQKGGNVRRNFDFLQ